MELGIDGRTALVCASSKGSGKACAFALAAEGVKTTLVARGADALEAAVAEIRAAGGMAVGVVGDITTPQGRQLVLDACPQVDILVTNAGGPPTGDFRDWDRAQWIAALDTNMLTPIELIKAYLPGMQERGFGRIVNLTSGAVKASIDVLGLSNGARSGLTGFVAGLARKTVAHNVTLNNLLPGPFETDRLRHTAEGQAQASGKTVDEVLAARRAVNPAGRFGQPAEFGAACAFLCSQWAGYITGQNILLDGGAYPGTF